MFLIFFQDVLSFSQKIAEQGVAIAVLVVILVFVLFLVIKILPHWKEVKIKEFEVRGKEAEATGQLSTSLTVFGASQNQLGIALGQLGDTIHDIAIEQKRATDNVLILQRVNSNEAQNISQSVENLVERIDALEDNFKEQGLYATRPKAVKKTGN